MSAYGFTANYRFTLIDYASRSWHSEDWANLNLIDSLLYSNLTAVRFILATGTGDVITLTYSPVLAAYATGEQISFVTSAVNTTVVTVNVNGLGAKALKAADGSALGSGQLTSGMYVRAIYNGTSFTIIDPAYTGTQTPYVSSGDSGAIAATDADDFYIENSSDAGLSILTPAGYNNRIKFGRPLAPSAGGFRYDHSTDTMYVLVNSVIKLTIDSTGRVLMPAQPAFQAYVTGTTTAPTQAADLVFNTEITDVGNNFDTVTGKFTAPVAGTYEFLVQSNMIWNSSFMSVTHQFYKNNATVGLADVAVYPNGNTGGKNYTTRIILVLAAADYITFRYTFTLGGVTITSWQCQFSGNLIG